MTQTTELYGDFVASQAAKLFPRSQAAYNTLGISKFGVSDSAIVGAILEEFSARHSSPISRGFQGTADWISSLRNRNQGDIRAAYELLQLNPSLRASIDTNLEKIAHPTMIDLGPGNIQLQTAINLLDEYNQRYPSIADPLQIKQYNGDYRKLVADLISNTSGTTEIFASLMIERVATWFSEHAANWNTLTGTERDALAVAGYRMGIERLQDRFEFENRDDPLKLSYKPDPYKTPDAVEYMVNKVARFESNSIKALYQLEVQNLTQNGLCFASGTAILTAEGVRAIDSLRAGDVVLAFDAHASRGRDILVPRTIARVMESQDKELVEIKGTKVRATAEHRFLDSDGNFRPISSFRVGESLVSGDGRLIAFSGVSPVEGLHKVFNIEVHDLHTYVAGGFRVHNDCLQQGDHVVDLAVDRNGLLKIYTHNDRTGADVVISEAFNLSGGTTILRREEYYQSADATITKEYSRFDSNKNPVGEPKLELKWTDEILDGEVLGGVFGSQLGQLIAGNNIFAKIGSATLGATIAGNILEYSTDLGHSLLGYDLKLPADYGGSKLEFIAEQSLGDISADFIDNLQSQVSQVLGSLLVAEVAEAVGLKGFQGQVFTAVGSSISTQVINNIINSKGVIDAATLTKGISLGSTITALGTSVGSLLGARLGSELVDVDSVGEALFVSVGGSFASLAYAGTIGGTIGSALGVTAATASTLLTAIILPGIGALIGAVLGQVVGSAVFEFLDGLFGGAFSKWLTPDPYYYRFVEFDAQSNLNVLPREIGHDVKSGDSYVLGTNGMMQSYAETINNIVDSIGGKVDQSQFVFDPKYSYFDHARFGFHHGNGSEFGNNDFKVILGFDPLYINARGDMPRLLRIGIEYELSKLTFIDGNLLKIKAFEAWKAEMNTGYAQRTGSSGLLDYLGNILKSYGRDPPNQTPIVLPGGGDSLVTLQAYLQIADDYTLYLENSDPINALIAASPNSAFAVGWIATLLQAEALGLNRPYVAGRLDGALAPASTGGDHLISADGDDLVFADAGNDAVESHGGNDTVNGGDGNDRLDLGDGNDAGWAEGGDDIILAGAGDDVLDGGPGADSIDGGPGKDTAGYNSSPVGVTIALDGTRGIGGDAEGDVLKGIEVLFGSPFGDTLGGSGSADFLFGNGGDDVVRAYGGDDAINGGDGNDRLDGGAGNDSIWAEAGSDTVVAGEGDDVVDGGPGADDIDGGPGKDTAGYNSSPTGITVSLDGSPGRGGDADGDVLRNMEVLYASPFNDTLTGSEAADDILGNGGSDFIDGRGGNDWLVGDGLGQAGADSIHGGSGEDTIEGGDGDDNLWGDDGNDKVYAGRGRDTVFGGLGTDTILGDQDDDLLDGGDGDDSVFGGGGNDTLIGGRGRDILAGDDGNDVLSGDDGDDQLFGFEGNDRILGGAGNDIIAGESGDDTIDGGLGADVIYSDGPGTAGRDLVFGGDGDDVIRAGPLEDTVHGDAGDDQIYAEDGDDTVTGDEGDDFINAGAGNDRVSGGAGGDRILGYAGNDIIDGDTGNDSLYGLSGNDSLSGGDGDDRAWGDVGDDTLFGGAGNDALDGWHGRDVLIGGAGNDSLAGGDGDDHLEGNDGNDLIYGDRSQGPSTLPSTEAEILRLIAVNPGYKSWGLLYQGDQYTAAVLAAAPHQMLIINAARSSLSTVPSSEVLWTNQELAAIKGSGEGKLLLGYVSASKINSFWSQWSGAWTEDGLAGGELTAAGKAVPWLGAVDTGYPATREANYWVNEWRQVLFARVDSMIEHGFHGTLLDDAGEFFERRLDGISQGTPQFVEQISQNAIAMRDLVIALRTHADVTMAAKLGVGVNQLTDANRFQLYVNGAPYVLQDAIKSDATEPAAIFKAIHADPASNAYLNAIDGIIVENFFSGGQRTKPYVEYTAALYGASGVPMLSIDTDQVTQQQRIQLISDALEHGFMPYATESTDYGVLNDTFLHELVDNEVSTYNDDILGGAGNDTIYPGRGSDKVDGGDGVDRAVFDGTRQAHSINNEGGHLVVVAPNGDSDILVSVERLGFQDRSIAFDVSGNAGKVAKAVGAVFGGAYLSDKVIIGMGLSKLDSGISYPDLVAAAISTDLFAQLAGSHSNRDFVQCIYKNVVGVPPTDADASYFVDLLERGVHSQASLALFACETDLNAAKVDLTGLATRGLEYILPEG